MSNYLANLSTAARENRALRQELQSSIEKMIDIENKIERIYQVERKLWKMSDPSVISEDRDINQKWVEPKVKTTSLGHLSQIEQYTSKILRDLEYTSEKIEETRNISDHFPTQMPVLGLITSQYGYRVSPFATKKRNSHKGIDIGARYGMPIYAAGKGIVRSSKYIQSYGNFVDIDHGNGIVTRYAHASKLIVRKGQFVMPGQLIAKIGTSGRSTGPHLHFEVLLKGSPVDPEDYLFVKPPYSKRLETKTAAKKKPKLKSGKEPPAIGGGSL